MKTPSRRGATAGDPIKEATLAALNRVIEPLIELMLDAGVTVHELQNLVRERAVRVAMSRLIKEGHKESKSRAAIMTGLPRSVVASILRSSESTTTAKSVQLPARRILAAWNDDPRYSAANGNPAVLPIFGRGISFEQLVKRYGGGIPTRAMLDELTQMQAIERLADQQIKVRCPMPVAVGLTEASISALGDRCRDLLDTFAHNRQENAAAFFQGTALSENVDVIKLQFVRKKISRLGSEFIAAIAKTLALAEIKKNSPDLKSSSSCRLGATVYFFEETARPATEARRGQRSNRKNLRRRTSKDSKDTNEIKDWT